MFWKKNKTIEWPLFFFGFIGLGIVVSIAILIIIFTNKIKNRNFVINPLNGKNIEITITSPEQIKSNYQEAIVNLQNELQAKVITTNELFAKVENIFLSVRVPAEIRDNHLKVFLQIEKIKDQELGKNVEELKKEVLFALAQLVS